MRGKQQCIFKQTGDIYIHVEKHLTADTAAEMLFNSKPGVELFECFKNLILFKTKLLYNGQEDHFN